MRSGADLFNPRGFSFTHLHLFLIPVPCINVVNYYVEIVKKLELKLHVILDDLRENCDGNLKIV